MKLFNQFFFKNYLTKDGTGELCVVERVDMTILTNNYRDSWMVKDDDSRRKLVCLFLEFALFIMVPLNSFPVERWSVLSILKIPF